MIWRKSSHSKGGCCTEIAFRKSSHSAGGACPECGTQTRVVVVRDSKNPAGPWLMVPEDAWRVFLDGIRTDRP